jgi:hypothetical protein
MTYGQALRVLAGMLIGIGLGSLPFVQYTARTHTHAGTVTALKGEPPCGSHPSSTRSN